jgi:hypothetical protein
MAEISVETTGRDRDPYTFRVKIADGTSSTEHEVTLSQEDFAKWSFERESPERFIERCFEFLLAREPKESILRRFDVRDITRYFPEFESEISA